MVNKNDHLTLDDLSGGLEFETLISLWGNSKVLPQVHNKLHLGEGLKLRDDIHRQKDWDLEMFSGLEGPMDIEEVDLESAHSQSLKSNREKTNSEKDVADSKSGASFQIL